MKLSEFIETVKVKKVNLKDRWETRVVRQGLDKQGAEGAYAYLANYGKQIGAPKLIALARKAEAEGCREMAWVFWLNAYAKIHDDNPVDDYLDGESEAPAEVSVIAPSVEICIPMFPDHLQPKRTVTMQPIDAPQPRNFYIMNPDYGGQPKRDGWRLVTHSTTAETYYQSRSLKLQGVPAIEIDQAHKAAAAQIGPYILDGERVYKDAHEGEHKTVPEALQASEGVPDFEVHATYSIFKALFFQGQDLTFGDEHTRIRAGRTIAAVLARLASGYFEFLEPALRWEEKQALADRQRTEMREGEVWFLLSTPYIGGKTKSSLPPIVRTVYWKKLHAVILELVPTTVKGRAFASIKVGVYRDGELVKIGSIGTGFTMAETQEIAKVYNANPGEVTIKVYCRAFTVNDIMRHASYKGFSKKIPTECTWEGISNA